MNQTQFEKAANELIHAVKSGNSYVSHNGEVIDVSDRQARIKAINELTEEYVGDSGKYPDSTILERLADAVLHEDLTDDNPWKAKQAEYPFFSDRQMERRTNNEKSLYKESIDEVTVGIDKKDHRDSTKRRQREKYENAFMDRAVRSRNKEIARKYKEFTKVQPVKVYNLYDK
jgi:hypothetical protein